MKLPNLYIISTRQILGRLQEYVGIYKYAPLILNYRDAEEIPQPVSKLGSMTKNLKFDLKVMRVYIIYAGLALLAVLAMIMLVVRSSSRTSIQQPPVEIQMKDPAAKKEE
eukprot:TRINITY_DN15704_c0_g1_i6.p5 TRINITY_DN15704_c0_g1~~TRINITY_DN15704_c0_g1_i6.p5  ORF type:complete len:110 (-),score=12.58 TRINITY_DN15704_c0_g1_i6:302-631(-)